MILKRCVLSGVETHLVPANVSIQYSNTMPIVFALGGDQMLGLDWEVGKPPDL
jgi:hypothetical protein